GFSAVPAENQVGFHGALASVLSATDTQLVVTVPPGATTGPLTVTVAGNTAASSRNFTVPPSIAAIQPALALAGLPLPSVQVQGGTGAGLESFECRHRWRWVWRRRGGGVWFESTRSRGYTGQNQSANTGGIRATRGSAEQHQSFQCQWTDAGGIRATRGSVEQ